MFRRWIATLSTCALLPLLAVSTQTASPASAADPCVELDADDLRYGSAPLTGDTPPDIATSDCYRLEAPEGAVLQIKPTDPSVSTTVIDSAGRSACVSDDEPLTCRLVGEAPFELRVWAFLGTPASYELMVYRSDPAGACPAGATTPFGSVSPAMVVDDGDPDVACRELQLAAGPYLVLPDDGIGVHPWRIQTRGGQTVCVRWTADQGERTLCEVPASGEYRMLIGRLGDGSLPLPTLVTPAATREGCGQALDTSWSEGSSSQQVRGPVQADCRPLPGAVGDRIVADADFQVSQLRPGSGGSVAWRILDADGAVACEDRADEALGCLLEGRAPYRLVSWPVGTLYEPVGIEYRVNARSLSQMQGCPVVSTVPLGTRWTELPRAHGCWQIDAEAGREFQVYPGELVDGRPRSPLEGLGGYGVLGPDFEIACTRAACGGPAPGRHTVVTSLTGEPGVLGAYHEQESRGCEPLAADLTTVSERIAAAELRCFTVDVSAGTSLVSAAAGLPDGGSSASLTWYDSLGERLCPVDYGLVVHCRTQGPGPYHVVVGYGREVGVHLGLLPYTDASIPPPGCVDLPAGRSVRLSVGPGASTTCLAAGPAAVDDRIQVTRVSGSGVFRLEHLLNRGQCRQEDRDWSNEQQVMHCSLEGNDPSGRRTLALLAQGPVEVVVRSDPESTAPEPPTAPVTLRNLVRPALTGTPRAGRTLRVGPGRWSGAPERFAYRWRVGARWLPGLQRRTLDVKPWHRGRKVQVAVAAYREGSEPVVVRTRSVLVRRR